MIDGTFTVRELAVELDAPYAAVQRLLEREIGRTVRRIDDPGRSTPLWEVLDAPALESCLAVEFGGSAPDDEPAEDDEAALARRVAAAEDRLLMALRSHVMEDAEAFAVEALAALDGTALEPRIGDEVEPAELSLSAKRNLPSLDGRAWIVGAIAGYVTSRESAGLAGQRWRHAFRTLAAVDLPDQGSLQKALLVELVRVVDERADGRLLVDSLARAAEEAAGLDRFREVLQDSEAMWSAVATLLSQHRLRRVGKQATLRLCELAGGAGRQRDDVKDRLATALRELAFNPDAEIAHVACAALIAIAPPRDVEFWERLDSAQPPAPLALIFEGLARLDLGAAFKLLTKEQRARGEVKEALAAALPALASEAPHVVEERFTAFVCELPDEQRRELIAVPAGIGLDWSLPLARPLAQRLLSLLTEWRKLLDSRQADAPVARKLAELSDEIVELARESLLTVEPVERTHVRHVLTERLTDRAGASVAVRALLAVGAEAELVEALIRQCPYDTAESIARWYLDTLPRDGLSLEERKTLVHAAYVALGKDKEFVTTLMRRAAEIGDHLPELYDNGEIEPTVRARMMQDYYRAWPEEDRAFLKEVASAGGRHA